MTEELEFSKERIKFAILQAALAEWRRPVLDIHPDQPNTRQHIEMYFRDLGWDWFLDSHGEKGYDEPEENPESWCGIGLAWTLRHRLGEFYQEDTCVDVQIKGDIAKKILPGTDRIYSQAKWNEIGLPYPEQPDIEDLERGDIVTTGSGVDGSHITIFDGWFKKGEKFDTVEFNGIAELGNGFYGEGVVRSRKGKIKSYTDTTKKIQPRSVDEICQTYSLANPAYYLVGSNT